LKVEASRFTGLLFQRISTLFKGYLRSPMRSHKFSITSDRIAMLLYIGMKFNRSNCGRRYTRIKYFHKKPGFYFTAIFYWINHKHL